MADADLIYGLRLTLRRQAPEVFMDAMMAGYVSDSKKSSVPELAGSKQLIYTCHDWKVTDTYIVTPAGDQSAGMTIISYGGIPVWSMQYLGKYTKEAIPFLKEALAENYKHKIWHGGRGPGAYDSGGWVYTNHPVVDGFDNFHGYEGIHGPGGLQGWHRYSGIWMVN
jgi:hypothetical protein